MQQHPVPQNITSYEFHLIGNMTVKQFIELGGGIGVGVFFYASNLPFVIKWPLIIFCVCFGAALAFVPFEGRPLDKMILAFIRAVYSPTQFIWRKTPTPPSFLTYTTPTHRPQETNQELEKRQARKNLGQYLDTLPDDRPTNLIDQHETQFLQTINTLYQQLPQVIISTTQTPPPISPRIVPRSLAPKAPQNSRLNFSRSAQAASVSNIDIPVSVPTAIEKTALPIATKPATTSMGTAQPLPQSSTLAPPSTKSATTAAPPHKNLPFPQPPETPNTLVGMILTADGKIVDNAIIEVRNSDHLPVRALKTNKLGQFFSATSLENGTYEIEAEKDGFKFAIVKLDLNGKLVPPLEIRSTT